MMLFPIEPERWNHLLLPFIKICTELFVKEEFQPLDPTQELIFPPELLVRGVGCFMCLLKCHTGYKLSF